MTGRFANLIIFGCMVMPALSVAQGPWTGALTPARNPLPVGGCSAVYLTLIDPATRDWPRNPIGQRVSIADFDITVSTPDGISAAAQYAGPRDVSACGCQGAKAGTVATVTATYPARGLKPGLRVPGVAFETVAPLTLARPQGSSNPPECAALASAPAQTVATAPTLGAAKTPAGTAPLTVVANEEWTTPYQTWNVSPGQCVVLSTRYTNPNILMTDHAVVTGRQLAQGVHLRWTAEAANGSLQITLCMDAKSLRAGYSLSGLGPKVNILVLR